MADYDFERECRTPHSECYTVVDAVRNIGRLDIHFAESIVHCTLSIDERLTDDDIQELIDLLDRNLIDAAGILRREVIVHVHQGRDLGVYSTREDYEGTNGGGYRN